MGKIKRIHLVGIGGAGMCGIAEILQKEGYFVSGSDLEETKVIQRLRTIGITVFIGHKAEQVDTVDVVVCSTAVKPTNPEVIRAKERKIPIVHRAEMLAELMRFRVGIAVAGTHGKTTTTSLVTSILKEGGLDPSFMIGGKLHKVASNAALGNSCYFVTEADESDASFLHLQPMMAIVTNIDADHLETYGNDFAKLHQTFLQFLHQLPFHGLAVLCADEEAICRLLPALQRPYLTYGFQENAHYRALDWVQKGLISECTVLRPAPFPPLRISLPLPGRHNIQNALAAIAIGVEDQAICAGLAHFQGVGRRFQILGEKQFCQGSAIVIDDYGHHPTEIAATLNAVRKVWPDKRLIHVFQPHRYSRTQSLFKEFVEVLGGADALLLLDIYAAGEAAISGVTTEVLLEEIRKKAPQARYIKEDALVETLDSMMRGENILLMQGAGSISQFAAKLMESFKENA
jgi:UDP-N-acetylmuramate--alanine ligase